MEIGAVLKAEVFDPEKNRWLLTAPATVPRNYHGVALLPPDGRVWTASGSQDHSGSQCGWFHNIPPMGSALSRLRAGEDRREGRDLYALVLRRRDRPVMTSCPARSCPMAGHSRSESALRGADIGQRVVLIRAGSPTHSFDADQRLIQLDVTAGPAPLLR